MRARNSAQVTRARPQEFEHAEQQSAAELAAQAGQIEDATRHATRAGMRASAQNPASVSRPASINTRARFASDARTIANALDHPIATFGAPAHCTGALPTLLARG